MGEADRYRVAQRVDRGRRPINQDAVVAHRFEDGREVVALADGMGGHVGGEVASRRALEILVSELERGAGLRAAVEASNAAVHEEAQRSADLRGMGTTLVAVLVAGGEYEVASVGDSRAYRIGADGILQLTTDHSFLAEAVRSGQLSREEAARSPWRNALTRALGTDPEVEVDVLGPYGTDEPHTLLLCSDGLYRAVTDEAMVRQVHTSADADSLARDLADQALANGSDDNVAVALIVFGGLAAAPADAVAMAGAGADGAVGIEPSEAAAGPWPESAVEPGSGAESDIGPRAAEPAEVGRRDGGLPGRRRKMSRPKVRAGLMKYEVVVILVLLLVAVGFAFLLTVI